jgi:hypothetical protein
MPIPYAVIVIGLLTSVAAVHASEQEDTLIHDMQGVRTPWHVDGDSNGRLPNQSWTNYEYFDGFFAMRSVKSTYIGLFCLWLIWIIIRMVNSLFGKSACTTPEITAAGNQPAITTAEDQPATAASNDPARTDAYTPRVSLIQ